MIKHGTFYCPSIPDYSSTCLLHPGHSCLILLPRISVTSAVWYDSSTLVWFFFLVDSCRATTFNTVRLLQVMWHRYFFALTCLISVYHGLQSSYTVIIAAKYPTYGLFTKRGNGLESTWEQQEPQLHSVQYHFRRKLFCWDWDTGGCVSMRHESLSKVSCAYR